MEIGDRVKFGMRDYNWAPKEIKYIYCIITRHNVFTGVYEVKDIENGTLIEAWGDEIELDVEYYRDLKLKELLNE